MNRLSMQISHDLILTETNQGTSVGVKPKNVNHLGDILDTEMTLYPFYLHFCQVHNKLLYQEECN